MLLKLELSELRPDLGFDVARYLPAALALARSRHPEVVVLGIDGWPEGARRIYRCLQQIAGEKVEFVLVGRPELLLQYHDLPALARLSRPVKLPELRAAIAQAGQSRVIREDVVQPSPQRQQVHPAR